MKDSVIGIYSEIDPMEKVIVHTPGPEIESITPENAHKALYSDILNLSMARKEHNQFTSVLSKIAKTYDLKCIPCGGNGSITDQEREQWHSVANCFAWAPGKLLGYGRNVYTTDIISKEGYEVLNARDVINDSVSLSDYQKCLVIFDGDELARGGGGARCMTLPLKRKH